MANRVLMVIAPDQYRDEELNVPRSIFRNEGWTVETVSTRTGECRGMLGDKDTVTQTVSDVQDELFDAVVVVGGMGSPEYLWDNKALHHLLQAHAQADKVVSSICLSGAVLAKAGVLHGKQATVWEMPESVDALKKGGATFTRQPVSRDGRFITANGPDAAAEFGRSVVEAVRALQPA